MIGTVTTVPNQPGGPEAGATAGAWVAGRVTRLTMEEHLYVVIDLWCMYYACMPNVQVRDVPDEVHKALVRRAELAGQSLQQFLASQLAQIAATPTIDEMLERIERRPKGRLSAESAIEAIDEERARR